DEPGVEGQGRRRGDGRQVEADGRAVGGRVGAGVVELFQQELLPDRGLGPGREVTRLQFFKTGGEPPRAGGGEACGGGQESQPRAAPAGKGQDCESAGEPTLPGTRRCAGEGERAELWRT